MLKITINLLVAVLFVVYLTAPMAAMGFLPMAVGLITGALMFVPFYRSASEFARKY